MRIDNAECVKKMIDGTMYIRPNGEILRCSIYCGSEPIFFIKNGNRETSMTDSWGCNDWEEYHELDFSMSEHDPEDIPDLWPVEVWDEELSRRFGFEVFFFDRENKGCLSPDYGDREGSSWPHFRAIPKDDWSPKIEASYKKLRERYYGAGK